MGRIEVLGPNSIIQRFQFGSIWENDAFVEHKSTSHFDRNRNHPQVVELQRLFRFHYWKQVNGETDLLVLLSRNCITSNEYQLTSGLFKYSTIFNAIELPLDNLWTKILEHQSNTTQQNVLIIGIPVATMNFDR